MTTPAPNRPSFCTFVHGGHPRPILPSPTNSIDVPKFAIRAPYSDVTIGIAHAKTFTPLAQATTATTVKVEFTGGDADKQNKVLQYAGLWSVHAYVDFTTGGVGPAKISVSFEAGGNYAILGEVILINIGALANPTDNELRRDVLHEFGHALGLLHEHQNPNADIQWNQEEVYQWYQDNEPKMGKAEVDLNIMTPVVNPVVATAFDPDSIMTYHIPPALTSNGKHTIPNMVLSATDKVAIKELYPGRA